VSTPSLKNGEPSLGLCSITRHNDAPARVRGPLEALLSRKWYCVLYVCVVYGMVCTRLRVLSLSIKEGRSTFGVMAGIWAKF